VTRKVGNTSRKQHYGQQRRKISNLLHKLVLQQKSQWFYPYILIRSLKWQPILTCKWRARGKNNILDSFQQSIMFLKWNQSSSVDCLTEVFCQVW